MKRVLFLLPLIFICGSVWSQGIFNGSFESNTIFYVDDSKIGSFAPEYSIGSNNYLKLDYTKGRF